MPKLAHRVTMPRPNDPDIIRRFADATRKGHPVATAATLAGLEQSTASRWLTQGRDEAELRSDGELGSHVAFFMEHERAVAAFAERNLDVVNEAAAQGAKGWLPAMTLLERRMPRDFGRNERLEIDTRTVAVSVTLEALPEGQREALIAALSRTTGDNSEPTTPLLAAPSDTNADA